MTTKKEQIDEIRRLLRESDSAVESALIALYDQQTPREQSSQATLEHNGAGFNSADAELLSSFAQQVLDRRARGRPLGRSLSQPRHGREGQIGWARRKLMKYAGQLHRIGWTYTPPPNEPRKASNLTAEPQTHLSLSADSGSGGMNRLAALEEAWRRIGIGRQWIRDHPSEERGAQRLARLEKYAAQLVADARPEDIRQDRFRELARQVSPCSACSGTGKHPESGKACYRCSAKGFQTVEDERRNDQYEEEHRRAG